MLGVFLDGQRPKSKVAIRRFLASGGDPVLEKTSPFSSSPWTRKPLSELSASEAPTFVGPDPYTKRVFYGSFYYNREQNRWEVR